MDHRHGRSSTRSHPPPPWWKRRNAKVVGSIAVAALSGLVGAWVIWIAGPPSPASTSAPGSTQSEPAGPPVDVDSVTLQRYTIQGETVLFAKQFQISNTELNRLSKDMTGEIQGENAFYAWARANGGVDPNVVFIQLVVTGNRNHKIRIIDMQAHGTCGPPLTGTMMESQPAGGDNSIFIGFDLDKRDPEAKIFHPTAGGFGGYYFRGKTVSLEPHEQQTFEIAGVSTRYYCTFNIELTVLDGHKQVIETIQNGHQPFKVSGTLPLSRYHAAYLGGISRCRAGAYWMKTNPVNVHC
jgi:hypothetical protein